MFELLLTSAGVLFTVGMVIAAIAQLDWFEEQMVARVAFRLIGGIIALLGAGAFLFSLYSGSVSPLPDNGQSPQKPGFMQTYSMNTAATMYHNCPELYSKIDDPASLEDVSGAEYGIVQDVDGNRYSFLLCKQLKRDAIIAEP